MKPKVTYRVDYEDVPNIINRMVSAVKDTARRVSDLRYLNEENIDSFLAELRLAKESISGIELQIEDCLNMCIGYSNADPTNNSEVVDVEQED